MSREHADKRFKPADLSDAALKADQDGAGDGVERLDRIMRRLRDPETGCPWDREQTFETIAPYTIEEAYEVADAIERGDAGALCDELGDLLLQVVYHARIADERGLFDLADVARAVSEKMLRRHPHVFDGAESFDWETIKAAEKAERRARARERDPSRSAEEERPPGLLDDIPAALPALTRAEKLQARAARVGFEWDAVDGVLDKIVEESRELAETIGDAADGADARRREEFGDLLFVMTNLARRLGVDPEDALRGANAKFARRFAAIERGLAARGRTPAEADLDEMEALWAAAKAAERG